FALRELTVSLQSKDWIEARDQVRALRIVALLACAACSVDGTVDSVQDDVIAGTRVHAMPLRGRQIRAAAADPAFTYHGGPVLSRLNIVEILWSKDVSFGPELGQFYGAIADSEYFDLLAEYGTPTQSIGRGSFQGLITDPSPPGSDRVEDSTIQNELVR